MSKQSPSSSERRSFLTRFNAGAASIAALAMGGVAMAQVKSAPAARFRACAACARTIGWTRSPANIDW